MAQGPEYTHAGVQMRVVVVVLGAKDEHTIESPWMSQESAEEQLGKIGDAQRASLAVPVELPWLRVGDGRLIRAAYLDQAPPPPVIG
jgi:hypothetical protein